MKYLKGFLILCGLHCLSCANIQGIQGGPKDQSPPLLLEKNSSPNFQLNFKEREIILTFDEWIRVDNPSSNISISPSTQYPLEFKLKGKSLFIRLDDREILQENTTYNIQFGECIKDITASNIQRDLKYIFSTGDFLDSLSLQVYVLDAFTKKPKDKALVSLYKNLDDSAFQKIKPFYFGWTDTSGRIHLKHLSPGFYRLYSLEDKNQNYYYDQINEAFAFYPQPIHINDTFKTEYSLFLSAKSLPALIREKKIENGIAKIYFKEKPHQIKLTGNIPPEIQYIHVTDSVFIWNTSTDDYTCILDYDTTLDTFIIPGVEKEPIHTVYRLKKQESLILPDRFPAFVFNYPIVSIDKNEFKSIDSISEISGIKLDSLDPRKFYIEGRFSSKIENKIVVNEHAVKGIQNTSNVLDTFSFKYLEKNSLSVLRLHMQGLQHGIPYIIQLVLGENVGEELKFEVNDSTKKIVFNNVIPGIYRLRLIHDKNKNGRWDAGDYSLKNEPEKIWYFELPILRADWDIEVSIKL